MPELPEVRSHAERLDGLYRGATLDRVEVLAFTALKTPEPSPNEAHGHRLDRVGQRGKYLLLSIGPVTFAVHLMQGGRLRPDPRESARPRNGLVRWWFDSQEALLLTEAGKRRRAGVWPLSGDALTQDPLNRLGPEADTVRPDQLRSLGTEHPMRLHGFLRDQRIIAGVGRRLANEICHRARLSPFAATKHLTAEQADAIVSAMRSCIEESLIAERERDDISRSADRPAAVHHRQGEPCGRCGDEVRAIEYSDYTINYCATCQTGGKILADNTTSRFLK